eukprot:scaffold12130_cov56-Phaeocystis_antarctica.AAC.3
MSAGFAKPVGCSRVALCPPWISHGDRVKRKEHTCPGSRPAAGHLEAFAPFEYVLPQRNLNCWGDKGGHQSLIMVQSGPPAAPRRRASLSCSLYRLTSGALCWRTFFLISRCVGKSGSRAVRALGPAARTARARIGCLHEGAI